MRIIVTAFDPFKGLSENSSEYSLRHAHIDKSIKVKILSVDLNKTKEELCQIIESNPDLLIMFGQSGKDPDIHIETRAHNILNFKIKDNGGNIPTNLPIIEGGDEYLSTPIDYNELNEFLLKNNIPSKGSDNAGEFICNYSYYLALNSGIKCIFIHLPLLETQDNNDLYHYLPNGILIKAVELTIKYLENNYDN